MNIPKFGEIAAENGVKAVELAPARLPARPTVIPRRFTIWRRTCASRQR